MGGGDRGWRLDRAGTVWWDGGVSVTSVRFHWEGMAAVIGGALALGMLVLFVVSVVKSFTRKSPGWIVSATLSGVLCLLMVAGSAVAGLVGLSKKHREEKARAQAAAEQARRGEKGGVMISKDKGMQITVPETWTGRPPTNKAYGVLTAVDLATLEQVVVMRRSREDVSGSLSDFEAHSTELLLKEITNGQAGEPQASTAGDYPRVERRLEGSTEGGNFVYETDTVETKDAYYRLVARVAHSKEAAAQPVFQQIFDSFHAESGPPVAVEKGEGQ